jgi:mRNA interferase MazF
VSIRRGEIRWADLDPVRGREQAGRRPVLVLSRDSFNVRSGTAIAVALSSQPQRAGFPFSLQLCTPTLRALSWVKISLVRVLAAQRISDRLGAASPRDIERVIAGLKEIIRS